VSGAVVNDRRLTTHTSLVYTYQGVNVHTGRTLYAYVNRTLNSLYDENKLCVSYFRAYKKFTKVSLESFIDFRKQ